MKDKIPIFLSVSLLLISSIFGQNHSKEHPFRKEGSLETVSDGSRSNIITLIEHIIIPSEFLNEWELNNDTRSITYDIAREWVESGKAEIEHSTLLMQRSGQKASINSISELIYPTEFYKQGLNAWPVPTAFEIRNLGYLTELEVVVGSDKKLDSRSLNEYITFIESKSSHALIEKTRHPEDMFHPHLSSHRVPSNIKLIDGQMTLIGRSGNTDQEKTTRLVFQRTESVPLLPVKSGKEIKTTNIELKVCSVTLENSDWTAWTKMKDNAELSRESWEWAKKQIERKRAEVSFTRSLVIPSGEKGVIEGVKEIIYATEFVNPVINTTREKKRDTVKSDNTFSYVDRSTEISSSTIESALVPESFTTREVGNLFGASAVKGERGHVVDVTFSLEDSKLCGYRTYHRVRDEDGEWKPDVKFPIFASIRQKASIYLSPQTFTLMGAAAAVKDDGVPDSSKRVLYFIQVK